MSTDRRSRWPNPTDTALDRARAVLFSYRAALLEADPDCCAALDSAAVALGEGWVVPSPEPDEWVSEEEAARVCFVAQSTVRVWAANPDVPVWRHPNGFRLAELRAYQASQRMQRRRGIRG